MSFSIDKKSLFIGIVFILVALGVMYFSSTQAYKNIQSQDIASDSTTPQP